jgi:hypothetical protein
MDDGGDAVSNWDRGLPRGGVGQEYASTEYRGPTREQADRVGQAIDDPLLRHKREMAEAMQNAYATPVKQPQNYTVALSELRSLCMEVDSLASMIRDKMLGPRPERPNGKSPPDSPLGFLDALAYEAIEMSDMLRDALSALREVQERLP